MPNWERMTESPEGMVEFRILGPVDILVDEQALRLGSPKERCVLAMLLWRMGQPVAADALVDAVWGDRPPASARASLHSYVSRLRNTLKGAAARLQWRSGYYLLEADPATVDLHQFRALREQARAIGDSGDDEQASALLRKAEKLWRGEPLAGLSGEWADRTRVTLEEERFGASCDRISVDLRLGRHGDLVGEVYDLARRHPFDQAIVGHLMLALYRCGRVSDALDVYRRTRQRLIEETGSEPNPDLRDLHRRILNEDSELAHAPMARPSSSTSANSLPRDNPDFTGRTVELRELRDHVDSDQSRVTATVVAITGMPGVGKSTFAIHAANLLGDRYPERFYLHMHTHDHVAEPVDPAAGLNVLLRTLGVPSAQIPESVEDRATLWRTKLANRRALILLDDASEPEQIQPLLPGAPGCLVLVTCRRRTIGLPGMSWIHLDTMQAGEATSLFAQIIGAERANDTGAVAEVVRLCGYLPLRIQLAGSRLRQHPSWNVGVLAAQLSRRADGHRSRIRAEDREVANSLDLSYQYLTNQEQQVFRRLALHPGATFSVFAVAAAAGSDSLDIAERVLERLLDHHLLEEPEPDRFTFHDLIRDYAWQRTQIDDSEPERQRIVHRLLDYYLCLGVRAAEVVYPFQLRISTSPTYLPAVLPPLATQADCQSWLEAERVNMFGIVRYAAGNGWYEHAALLPQMLAKFLFAWGQWADAVELCRIGVRGWREIRDDRGKSLALTDLCFFLGRMGRYAEALECGREALAIARGGSDRAAEASALDRIGLVFWQSSRYQEALASHEEALNIWRTAHDRHGEADALAHSAISFLRISEYDEALSRMGKALAIYREIGDLLEEGRALNNIGDAQQDLGYHDEAFRKYQQALAIFQEAGSRQEEAVSLNNVANVYRLTGRYRESLEHYRKVLRIYREIGDRRCESDALNNIGEAFWRSNHYNEALIHYQKALAISHELAEPYQEARSLLNIGNLNLQIGRYPAAVDDFRAALELGNRIGATYQEALAWDGLGSALLHTDGAAVAKKHWLNALSMFERIGMREAAAVRERIRTLHATATVPGTPTGLTGLPVSPRAGAAVGGRLQAPTKLAPWGSSVLSQSLSRGSRLSTRRGLT